MEEDKIISITDLAVTVQEALEKIETTLKDLSKRMDKMEGALASQGSQQEIIDERLTKIEQELINKK